jgi:hypothetical protein
MKQLTLAIVGFARYGKRTRRAAFLGEMERVVRWSAPCALIDPYYPNPTMAARRSGSSGCWACISCSTGSICRTRGCKRRDSLAMRPFVGIYLGREPVPQETTVCRFRHLLEEHDLGGQLFDAAHRHLTRHSPDRQACWASSSVSSEQRTTKFDHNQPVVSQIVGLRASRGRNPLLLRSSRRTSPAVLCRI